jgi:hypothetical protein
MRQYDEDAEVQLTATAIEAGESAEAFAKRLAAPDTLSPLDLLLRGGLTLEAPAAPPPPRALSLFESDFAYVREVIDVLAENDGLERRVDEVREVIEVQLPPDTAQARRERRAGSDLRRRLCKLPIEVVPEDGVLVITPDRARMQDEIKSARREESAWPKVSFLWPLHPVVDWCNDKALAPFGRLEAPVLSLLDGIGPGEAVVLVSALLPNRRSQPLFQEWYAVQFVNNALREITPFSAWAEQAKLARRALPNRNQPIDLSALGALVPSAVEVARTTMLAHWRDREADIDAKLNRELNRLESLRNRRFAQEVLDFGQRDKNEIKARVEKLFAPFLRFVQESMTAGKEPFIEVLAVFRHENGYRPSSRPGAAS